VSAPQEIAAQLVLLFGSSTETGGEDLSMRPPGAGLMDETGPGEKAALPVPVYNSRCQQKICLWLKCGVTLRDLSPGLGLTPKIPPGSGQSTLC